MRDQRFEMFVEQHYEALLRYAMVLTGDRHEAGDLVHDTLLKRSPSRQRGRFNSTTRRAV